ncbi:MAG: hypothetical protein ACP5S8_08100 [Hydrogenobaculum sp.]
MKSSNLATIKNYLGALESWKTIAILISIFALGGLIPDIIIELANHFIHNIAVRILVYFVIICFVFALLYLTYNKLKESLEHIDYEVVEVKPSDVKVAILALSIPNDASKEMVACAKEQKEVDFDTISKNYDRANWIMPLYLIKNLKERSHRFKKIVVIPSNQSEAYVSDFADVVKKVFPDIDIESTKGVNYKDLIELQKHMKKIIENLKEKEKYSLKNITIDCTAGTALYSIIASSITFYNDIVTSYVKEDKELMFFDMKRVEK